MDKRAAEYKQFKPTKIKIPEGMDKEQRRHLAHPINILIRDYNDFVALVLRKMAKKDSNDQKQADIQSAQSIALRLNLKINKN